MRRARYRGDRSVPDCLLRPRKIVSASCVTVVVPRKENIKLAPAASATIPERTVFQNVNARLVHFWPTFDWRIRSPIREDTLRYRRDLQRTSKEPARASFFNLKERRTKFVVVELYSRERSRRNWSLEIDAYIDDDTGNIPA